MLLCVDFTCNLFKIVTNTLILFAVILDFSSLSVILSLCHIKLQSVPMFPAKFVFKHSLLEVRTVWKKRFFILALLLICNLIHLYFPPSYKFIVTESYGPPPPPSPICINIKTLIIFLNNSHLLKYAVKSPSVCLANSTINLSCGQFIPVQHSVVLGGKFSVIFPIDQMLNCAMVMFRIVQGKLELRIILIITKFQSEQLCTGQFNCTIW